MSFEDPIIAEIELGLARRCAGMKTDGKRCKRTAPPWWAPQGTTPWYCRTHEEQGR
jgi:hypothetical protein